MANGRPDDPDNEPTRYGGFGEPTQAANYGGNTGGQAYSEYQGGPDYTDYGAATEYAGQAPPPEPPTPWFRKPGVFADSGEGQLSSSCL